MQGRISHGRELSQKEWNALDAFLLLWEPPKDFVPKTMHKPKPYIKWNRVGKVPHCDRCIDCGTPLSKVTRGVDAQGRHFESTVWCLKCASIMYMRPLLPWPPQKGDKDGQRTGMALSKTGRQSG